MDILIFQLLILLSIGVFFVPKRHQYYYALAIQLLVIAVTSSWAIDSLFTPSSTFSSTFYYLMDHAVAIVIDPLSAFFILVINITMLTGILYAKGYLKSYTESKNKTELALHYFSFVWLHISMLLVCMFRDGLSFLIAWEIMSISSFFLVIFESEKEQTLKIGINYLIQMHIGLVFIMTALIVAYTFTGNSFSFDGLAAYFEHYRALGLFLLFFIGFSIKAGFIPFHTWLPHAHPAAPSHVSAVMSGVMIKMGIYGILRVLTYVHTDLLYIGVSILFISAFSGMIGVTLAIVQRDIKKLLAYSSIENIGIIGIGIGLGVIGVATNIPFLAVLGFLGGLLHILNHSLFKSLLFYSAGSVYKQTHTRNIEQLGGLIKKMPYTALFFLLGVLAICGLPPFNGFISEFLIYSGMFKGLLPGNLLIDVIILASLISLALIGGLAIFCFTKVFSIVFLGNARTNKVENTVEVSNSMIFPKVLVGILILAIGVLPTLFVDPLINVVSIYTSDVAIVNTYIPILNSICIPIGIFILLIIIVWLIKRLQQKKHKIQIEPTWGCGYTGADAAVHQYTATSYADNYGALVSPIVNVKKQYEEFKEDEIFAPAKTFTTHSEDIFEEKLVTKPFNKILHWMEKVAVFQTGNLQHYLLYALVFMILIFVLTFTNLI